MHFAADLVLTIEKSNKWFQKHEATISETRNYNLSTLPLLKLTNNLTKTKMEFSIGFDGAETNNIVELATF